MYKKILILFIFGMISLSLFAENLDFEKNNKFSYIPLVKYDYLSLEDQSINSPSMGMVLQNNDFMFVGLYTYHKMGKNLQYEYPKEYHSIDLLLDAKKDRHQYLGIFKSESNQPVYGGLKTFQTALAYGYELSHKSNLSLVLGGGLAVSDFGIEISNGKTWPLIPVPLIRIQYESKFIKTKFEFLTSPNFDFTITPRSQFRFVFEARLDQFRDDRDLIFESSLVYRFFSVNHPMGDFAGIALGFKNDNYGAFDLGDCDTINSEDEESIEIHYNAIFGTLDLTLLKISGGYAFNGRELYLGEETGNLGNGYFLSIQGMYQF